MSKVFLLFKPWLFTIALAITSFSNNTLATDTRLAESNAVKNQFPLRSHFSHAIIISHKKLAAKFNDVLVIDVRSAYEFNILHINGAINIPITNLGFIPVLKSLRANDSRDIIFYCNGTSCKKSYLAHIKAQKNNIDNTYAFDLGILGWAKRYPKLSTFFGESPFILSNLISSKKFDAHNLSPKKFIKKIAANTLVVDIREPFQRDTMILERESILTPLDKFHYILTAVKKRQLTLLIYDAVGKQVKWLQYSLEKEGIKNYYFMKGGVRAYQNTEVN